jgi:hypothetical protein
MREMHTFRKLPMTMPRINKKNGITVSTVPQAEERLNARRGGACPMANGWGRIYGRVYGASVGGVAPFGERKRVR